MSERTIRSRCACGWEMAGPEDDVVRATIEHGGRLHNMVATRDQVLERAEIVGPDDDPAVDRGSSAGAAGA